VRNFIGTLLTIYLVILFCRAVLSWFPLEPGTIFAQINRILFDLTEPVLRPFRRIIPPAGMFDLSFIVVIFGIIILRSIVLSG
jgi:YggT family protein